jgi:zinc transporter ZupT
MNDPRFALVPALLALLAAPGCLLVKQGVQNTETLALAALGAVLLFVGLRFLMGRLERPNSSAAWRFATGLIAGIMIFLA